MPAYACTFTVPVAGNAGDTVTDTVTASATDDDGNTVTGQGTANVSIARCGPVGVRHEDWRRRRRNFNRRIHRRRAGGARVHESSTASPQARAAHRTWVDGTEVGTTGGEAEDDGYYFFLLSKSGPFRPAATGRRGGNRTGLGT